MQEIEASSALTEAISKVTEFETQSQVLKTTLQTTTAALSDTQTALDAKTADLASAVASRDALQQQFSELEDLAQVQSDRANALDSALTTAKSELETANQTVTIKTQIAENARAKVAQYEQDLTEANSKVGQMQTHIDILYNSVEVAESGKATAIHQLQLLRSEPESLKEEHCLSAEVSQRVSSCVDSVRHF